MKLLASGRFILQPVLSVAIYVLSVLCVPLTTYPQGFDTFLLAHKVNSKYIGYTQYKATMEAHWVIYVCKNICGSHGWKCKLCVPPSHFLSVVCYDYNYGELGTKIDTLLG